jgi:hypothetical protein
MKVLFAILCLTISAWAQEFQIENGWKGIVPLKTTRVEVEKILGVQSEKVNNVHTSYRTKDALIHFTFADKPCSNSGRGQFIVAKDTVLWYTVHIVDPIPLAELRWNTALYARFEDPHLMSLVHYGNKASGIRLLAGRSNGEEKIVTINYSGTKGQFSKLTCKKYR